MNLAWTCPNYYRLMLGTLPLFPLPQFWLPDDAYALLPKHIELHLLDENCTVSSAESRVMMTTPFVTELVHFSS